MRNLLDALQEGRLIELPVNEKPKALEYLALIIEAIPDIGTSSDIVKDVIDRETAANTGIGMGIACPHARTKSEGELLCAVGWSPSGIEYGAIDGKKVHLLIMYYIPDSQRNVYLKEISGLAKAMKDTAGIESIEELGDIQSVRNRLLDWVEIAMEKAIPISKARMIKLEAKQTVMEEIATGPGKLSRRLSFLPFSIIVSDNEKLLVLSHNQLFAETAEKSAEIHNLITGSGEFEWNGYQIYVSSSQQYSMNRTLYECFAVK